MTAEPSSPGSRLRLFLAVDVPSDVRDAVATVSRNLEERIPGARWAPPQNWHVTMKFLGSVDAQGRDWIAEAARQAASRIAAFETRVDGLGAFPSPRRARVLWAGLTDESGGFERLATALDSALATRFAPEDRAFTAHLTLARLRQPSALPDDVLGVDLRSRGFQIDRLTLYRSQLGRPHPRYEPLESFTLDVAQAAAEVPGLP